MKHLSLHGNDQDFWESPALDTGPRRSESPRYEAALDYLFRRINYERTSDIPYRSRGFKLDRMRALMQALGNPERQLKIVHVAGTKGKGSTAAFLSNIFWQAGYRVGRFTSPHLERLEERFWLNGENCSPDDIVRMVETISPHVEAMDKTAGPEDRLTFFELTTAMGFLMFAERQVEFAVVEVGLGGRLDSTNVCDPLLCVITSISRDHTALLGETLAEIAGEKAGIIKPNVPVISGATAEDARQVIKEVATRNAAPLYQAGDDFVAVTAPTLPGEHETKFHQSFTFRWKDEPPQDGTISAKGAHQVANAGLALAAVELLRQQGYHLPPDAVSRGLATTRLPARIECLAERPAVIVDAAHNDASAEALVRVLEEHFPGRRRHLVFASSGDKDHAGVLRQLLPAFASVWLTKFSFSPRATDPALLKRLAESLRSAEQPPLRLETSNNARQAFDQALAATGPDDVLVVTGSFFIAAEFKRFWAEVPSVAHPG